MIEESECEMSCGPADALEREEADEGRRSGIVGLPAEEEARSKGVALCSSEDGLQR